MLIHKGVLFKRGSGHGLFQRTNWKPRYFELTETHLSYYNHQGGALRGHIDVAAVDSIEMMPVDAVKTGSSASTNWRLGVCTPTRRLLLAANSEADMRAWADAFVRAAAALQRHHDRGKDTDRYVLRNA
ncbi:hypothetical protein SDRG_15785 [Saprolegnia diclina VS20]|uniref:PH domain-containing protein n=1 Tax=Saprolegnia diclina (strain VS20) TaxID=1156394 RepID=T0PLV8_SAPDV|nr:hypothetical protein SDRG_15785 [Saprolegnia diclina VS20]EQC26374.1 hypothetical protein SDRG_15785 [Saprolegnia diclina VS20]|eukprot:XP_008620189.1 hypothetical protein SDRG_15785 [Saprolegnia diclina VS20]